MDKLTMLNLIGLRIFALKGFAPKDRRIKRIPIVYVLFDDNETYLELEEQDPYTYYNFQSSARNIILRKDPVHWEIILKNYPDATIDFE